MSIRSDFESIFSRQLAKLFEDQLSREGISIPDDFPTGSRLVVKASSKSGSRTSLIRRCVSRVLHHTPSDDSEPGALSFRIAGPFGTIQPVQLTACGSEIKLTEVDDSNARIKVVRDFSMSIEQAAQAGHDAFARETGRPQGFEELHAGLGIKDDPSRFLRPDTLCSITASATALASRSGRLNWTMPT